MFVVTGYLHCTPRRFHWILLVVFGTCSFVMEKSFCSEQQLVRCRNCIYTMCSTDNLLLCLFLNLLLLNAHGDYY